MANVTRLGFGQVEPNHMSYKRTGQIYAQYPAAEDITILENGQFLKYNGKTNTADLEGAGEWLMVYNEIKLYDEREQMYKDFAMIKENYTPGSDSYSHEGWGPYKGQMTPRLVKTNIGDIFTTNTIEKANTSNKITVDLGKEEADYEPGTVLKIDTTTGFLSVDGDDTTMEFEVIESFGGRKTTMPDGQFGVKLMRIK